ncbi:MAG: gamma-glutamylcyclotransferase [Desulfobulbaceae bacterium]|nr:gamma-glutamylcyclotransferase [Desulfobulbaceae bacterium]
MLYFSYGSNMSIKRLQQRIPLATFVSIATLPCHSLLFHKIGQDSSAKCDARKTGQTADTVIGVVFEISKADKRCLDKFEGLGRGYNDKTVELIGADGRELQATTYYATKINAVLKPFHWYKNHVVRGAEENDIPAKYIQAIIDVESMADPEVDRHERETAIYR